MILVTGATGTIGSEVVRQLAARGEKVRAMTRNPGGARMPAGVEVVRGDFLDQESLEVALEGATAAFLVAVLGPADGGRDARLVELARAAGVGRLVKLSSIGTGDPAYGPFGTWHLPGEEALRAGEAEWTILRPSSFASNTLGWAEPIRAGRPVPDMTGEGRQGVVDPRDVSETAVEALTDSRHSGRTYTLTGPEAIRAADQAAVLAAVLGRPVRTLTLTPDQIRAQLTASGLDEAAVEGVVGGVGFAREGGNTLVTDDVRQALGRPARTYREWAEDHRQVFTGEG
ncbi:NAD(P)-dependent oxidoreductase [Streptomyces resistomycificus]|uniref:NmrA family transcriptional regulator n=2 Tax=Streptomyces resistomycificus TaxID=67356 RepID=A0A0L8L4B1_9ACTN|nr:NmrA family transcriptional regulator [Streptomyces resistomycificus]KUO01253.1 NAD(P)-dependent oxidoreductase [Streptomyces resistomycificus]